MKYVIVGTSHAGFEAVQTLLKKDSDAEIVVFEAGSNRFFLIMWYSVLSRRHFKIFG